MNFNHLFEGVSVQQGSLLQCRDDSGYEIVMRVNKSFKEQAVRKVFPAQSDNNSRTLFIVNNSAFQRCVNEWLNPMVHTRFLRPEKEDDSDST